MHLLTVLGVMWDPAHGAVLPTKTPSGSLLQLLITLHREGSASFIHPVYLPSVSSSRSSASFLVRIRSHRH